MANAVDTVFAADSGGNFLVTPNVGLMIWTLIAFGLALFLLQRLAFPRIGEALDKRRKAIEETLAQAKESREELMERTRRDIEAETRRALEEIRAEVANLTVMATEKLARKSLDDEDHRRLIDEALNEIDFTQLAPTGNGSGTE